MTPLRSTSRTSPSPARRSRRLDVESCFDEMILLGIDPGLDGALAILYTEPHHGKPAVWDVPVLTTGRKLTAEKIRSKREYDIAQMSKLLRDLTRFPGDMPDPFGVHACIEHVASRPSQGVVSMFSMGYGSGLWEGLLTGLGIPITRVGPQKWKHAMLQGVGTEKAASILRAKQLFPRVDLNGTRGKPRDGRAEALLIASYLKMQIAKGGL